MQPLRLPVGAGGQRATAHQARPLDTAPNMASGDVTGAARCSSGPAGRPWTGKGPSGPLSTIGIERDAVFGLMTEEQRRTQRFYIDRALSRRRKISRPLGHERTKLPSTLAWS